MKQIIARQFRRVVNSYPAWARHLTESVEITDYCYMAGSGITHLSPFLYFVGLDKSGQTACFTNCYHLKVAEGNFAGYVDFSESGVEKIGDLHITAPDKNGIAALFDDCENLKVAEGTFPGCVSFIESGITRVGELTITQPNTNGIKAYFRGCNVRLPVEFFGPEYEMDAATRQQILERIAAGDALKGQPEIEI